MSHGGSQHGAPGPTSGAHGHAPAPGGQALFPAQEWAMFQAEDRQAARNIVVLLTAVFSVGVVLYLSIALVVSSGP